VPTGRGVRPTPDRVREALFSILAGHTADARVLDAFAGAGALGLEAASRGAESVVLVERDRTTAEVLRDNVSRCDLPGVKVVVGDVVRMIPRLVLDAGGPFDLVLVDPPFREGLVQPLVAALLEADGLAPGGIVVIEHPADAEPSLAGLAVVDRRHYGTVSLALCESEA